MPNAARGDGVDSVFSPTGSGYNCASPMTTSTNVCSSNTFVNGIGSVRIGDAVMPHPITGCGTDGQVLSVASPDVYVNGMGAGRLGDLYGDNSITSGSADVFIN